MEVSRACPFRIGLQFLAFLLVLALPVAGVAQTTPFDTNSRTADTPLNGTLEGTVLDATGKPLSGALITVASAQISDARATQSDAEEAYAFTDLPAGVYRLTVSVPSFDSFTNPEIALRSGQSLQLPPVMMQVSVVSTSVEVTATNHDVAEAQMKSEQQQRILGILPNYYTVYFQDPAPLSAEQKMRLAFRSAIDPFNFAASAAQAVSEVNSKDFAAYGTGAEGFGKRFGAAYADGFSGTLLGSGVMPALLHQDPRYYYKGTGTVAARIAYALSWTVRCKGDNGNWQPNYSFLLGDIAAAGISDLYYPAALRNNGAQTVKYSLFNFASQGVNALLQEFLFKRITTHAKDPGK